MGCGSAKVLQNGTDPSPTQHASSGGRTSKAKRCKAGLFNYRSPSGAGLSAKTSGLPNGPGMVHEHPKGKDKAQAAARSSARENPYHEVRLQHNKVRPATSVYECSSARQYPDENFRVRTTVSGTSRIRVTLSSDGSMLEIETEKLPDPEYVRRYDDDASSDDSDGYVRLSPHPATFSGSGPSRITHAQVENYDGGRDAGDRPPNAIDVTPDPEKERSKRGRGRKRFDDGRAPDRLPCVDVAVQNRDNGCDPDGASCCHDCVAMTTNPVPDGEEAARETDDISRRLHGDLNNVSSSAGDFRCSRSTRRGVAVGRADSGAGSSCACCDGDGVAIRAKQRRSPEDRPRIPTPLSSPMSPSFMDGFNYECALASTYAELTLTGFGVMSSGSGIASSETPAAERRYAATATDNDASGSTHSTPGESEGPAIRSAGEQMKDACRKSSPVAGINGESARTLSDGSAPGGRLSGPADLRKPEQSVDDCCLNGNKSPAGGRDANAAARTSERREKTNDRRRSLTDGRRSMTPCDITSADVYAAGGCAPEGSARSRATPAGRANTTSKKKRSKFWLRKFSSENGADQRFLGLGRRLGKDRATKRGGGLPANKCLSFDSARVLESRITRDSPAGRWAPPARTAFLRSASAAPPPSDPCRSGVGECRDASEPGSSSASSSSSSARPHPGRVTAQTSSSRRSDAADRAALSSDVSRSSCRSSCKSKPIGKNTKQQIVEVGLMMSNPVGHEVSYSIALNKDTPDALDAVTKVREVASGTPEVRGHDNWVEAASPPEGGGTPTESLLLREQLDDAMGAVPAVTDINVHRDFFNSFEDLYDDEDVT